MIIHCSCWATFASTFVTGPSSALPSSYGHTPTNGLSRTRSLPSAIGRCKRCYRWYQSWVSSVVRAKHGLPWILSDDVFNGQGWNRLNIDCLSFRSRPGCILYALSRAEWPLLQRMFWLAQVSLLVMKMHSYIIVSRAAVFDVVTYH